MKPRNFPARKLARQIKANKELLTDHTNKLDLARNIRTKKNRSSKMH